VSKGYGAYHLHLVQPAISPVGEARPNQEVFRALGNRLGVTPEAGDDDLGEAGALLELGAQLSPENRAALFEGGPMPAPANGHPIQFVDVFPNTANGRVQLFPSEIPSRSGLYVYETDPGTARYPLALISPASEHTISSTLGEFRPGIARLKIHPDDAHPRSIADGEAVRIFNDLGEVQCEATISPEVRPGTIALPKGLWAKSTFNGSTANALVPDTLTDIAGGACFNDARVQVELWGRH
jgi:anaerobic selenocysteine-containing dehydrogenase